MLATHTLTGQKSAEAHAQGMHCREVPIADPRGVLLAKAKMQNATATLMCDGLLE